MTKITGTKIKMSQLFQNGKVIPVSVVHVTKGGEEIVNLKAGDPLKIVGTSKGKGFAGVVKRHGFHGGPKTHGQKNRLRAPGTIGNTTPQRVLPGRHMAGRMGGERTTIKSTLIEVNQETKTLAIKGPLPGNNRGTVIVIKI